MSDFDRKEQEINSVSAAPDVDAGAKVEVTAQENNTSQGRKTEDRPANGYPIQPPYPAGAQVYGLNSFGQVPQGYPMQGQPMQGQPMQGQPMQGQPIQGQPIQGTGYPHPWQAPYPAWQPSATQGTPPGWNPAAQQGHPGYGPGTQPAPSPQWVPGAPRQFQGQENKGKTGSGEDRYEDLKTAPFYNERYRKPGKGRMKGLVGPMIAIGLICSMLGGIVTGALFHFYGTDLLGASAQPATTQTASADTTLRQVEILNRTDEPITAIAEKAGPSVIGINVEYTYNDSFFGTQNGGGQGSGIIISSDGYILTNNHVVEAAANTGTSRNRFSNTGRITVVLPSHPDTPYEAKIVGLDAKTDIAVIKIEVTNLPVADIGDSDALVVGELAVAIGNPAGLEYMGSVTSGIISGLNRKVDTGDGNMLRLIQTDAAISPGNSGGALLNAEGEVIGVNSSKIGGTSYEGLGFAIPIKDAMKIAESLMKDGFVVRPQIGVSIDNTFTAEVAKANKVPEGVLIGEVMTGSPAEEAGLKAYDIITAFNGVVVKTYNELEQEKNRFNPGDTVKLTIYRIPEGAQPTAGETLEIDLILGSTANSNG